MIRAHVEGSPCDPSHTTQAMAPLEDSRNLPKSVDLLRASAEEDGVKSKSTSPKVKPGDDGAKGKTNRSNTCTGTVALYLRHGHTPSIMKKDLASFSVHNYFLQ